MVAPAFPVIQRKEPMDFETWRNIVLHNGKKYVRPDRLQRYYDAGWDAHECIEMILDLDFYTVPGAEKVHKELKKYKKNVYGDAYVNSQIALAVWRACGKLIGKNLAPSALQIVKDTKEQMEKILIPTNAELTKIADQE